MSKRTKKAKNQAIAEERALLAGTLPDEDRREEDRRAPEPDAQTSPAVASLAAQVLSGTIVPTLDESKTLAASALSQAPDRADAPVAPAVEEPVVVAPPEPAPLIPNDQISVVKERPDGKKVTVLGSILE